MQIVFNHGDEQFHDDKTVQVSTIRALTSTLPSGMWARFETVRYTDGRILVNGVLQARDKHGRRYFGEVGENADVDAQNRVLKWACRILRERAA